MRQTIQDMGWLLAFALATAGCGIALWGWFVEAPAFYFWVGSNYHWNPPMRHLLGGLYLVSGALPVILGLLFLQGLWIFPLNMLRRHWPRQRQALS